MSRICIFIATLFLLGGCTTAKKVETSDIYVSILPLRSLVKAIVGEDFQVEVLVPKGVSPETFEPTSKQFVGMNRAKYIFNVGLIDFETSLLSKIEDQSKVIDLSKGITTITGSCSHASHGHHHEHGVDPHIWTSPKALQTMATNIYEAIQRAYPDSTKYETNYQSLLAQLQALDQRTAAQINASGIKYFIIYHPALTYYARDYGIRQVAIEADGKEPSAKQLASIISQARKDDVRRIFYQSQFPASVVETIAKDIDAQYIEIDPLREDVIANIKEMTDQLTRP